MSHLHFVFDALPSPTGARFVELEDDAGRSINYGEWRTRDDGLAELLVPDFRDLMRLALIRLEEIYDPLDDGLYDLRAELRAALSPKDENDERTS